MKPDAENASKRRKIISVTKKDLKIDTFRSSTGAGGQKRDKTSSAVRITHRDSGAVGLCQEHRSRIQNQKVAFRRMAESPKFRTWVRIQTGRYEATVSEKVEEWMRPENLKVEVKKDGEWIPA